MSSNQKFVEIKGENWRSTYNHQKRPDQERRTRRVVPYDRLVNKRGKTFNTDKNIGNKTSKYKSKN